MGFLEPTIMKSTKKAYEEFLNGLPMNEDEFIMGGKFRERYCNVGKYGTCLRKYDPGAFEVGYREWEEENQYLRYIWQRKHHKSLRSI